MRWLIAMLGWMTVVSVSSAEDVLYLKDGKVIRCEITALTDNVLTYRTSIDLGNGRTASAEPTISPAVVDYIEFGPLPGEAAALADPVATALDTIRQLWDEKSRHLHRPRSNAGELGLLYGDKLLGEPESFQWDFALSVFDRIIERDWSPDHRLAARTGRLRALIQLGRLDTAIIEARQLAGESDDPRMLIEARHAIALADFEKLKQLESDHPKWAEDDTVRPERERLYHGVIDEFLWPYLFHGTEEALAARGLMAAAEAHRFAGKPSEARACLQDVLTLYPDTSAAEPARTLLKSLTEPESAHASPPKTETN